MANEQATETKVPNEAESVKPASPVVNWNDANMRTTYANAVNAVCTLEEVTLLFGTNQTWNPNSQQKVEVQLSDRIVLNPYAAKRLWAILSAVLKEYESRFGTLNLERAENVGGEGQS